MSAIPSDDEIRKMVRNNTNLLPGEEDILVAKIKQRYYETERQRAINRMVENNIKAETKEWNKKDRIIKYLIILQGILFGSAIILFILS